jgi:RND family efflux transporter MFP subunit
MRYSILILTVFITLFSCEKQVKTPKSNLENLQADRLKLQNKVDSLNNQLKDIEKAIRKLDTVKQLQKVTVFSTKDTIFNHYITLQGVVASDKNAMLRPEMGGTIQRILVKEGQRVSKGQTLVQLDASSFNDKVTELKTQLSLAKTTYERQKRLWDQKIGSEMQYLNAKTQKEGLENTLNSLYTQIRKMKIRAPFSGIVDAVIPKIGELTSPQTPVIRLINLNKVYIEADVPETYLTSIKKGTPVLIDFISINKQVTAKVNEVGNFINPNNRSFKIKIQLSNRDHSIKPNLLAELKINDFTTKGVVLPSHLIQMNQKGENYVFSIKEDNLKTSVVKRVLDLGIEYNNKTLIASGLQVNEHIVLEGGKFIKDGDEVEVTK